MVSALKRAASTRRSRNWLTDHRFPGAGEIRREVALEPRFREGAGMAEDAGRRARQHQRASARGIAGRAGERSRNAVADDCVRRELVRLGGQGQGKARYDEYRNRRYWIE